MPDYPICFSLPAAVWITYCLFVDAGSGAVHSICAALVHECGHLLCLRLCHCKPSKIVFGLFGMRIERRIWIELSYRQEFVVAMCGPLADFILSAVFFLLHIKTGFRINLAMGLFNLLPVRPMDGGQMLYALLCQRGMEDFAERWCKKIAAIGIVPVAAMGIWNCVQGKGNYSLLLSSLYVASVVLP